MKKYFHLLSLIIIGLAIQVSAQTKVIDIWNGNVPGAIPDTSYHFIADSSGSWTYMRNITNPKLDVYPAPEKIATGTAVIICPGGGYWGLAYKHEGAAVAKWLNSLGISAFVLKYRLPDSLVMINKTIGPLQDAQRAMRIVRSHSKEWNINPDKIGIMGFSAGGHLAASLSTLYTDKVYKSDDTTSARPDFSILIYPVISMNSAITHMGSRINLLGDNPSDSLVNHYSCEKQVDKNTPPAFLVQSLDDGTVPPLNSINYTLALKKHHIPVELHLYESGGHGYGLGRSKNTESQWPEACEQWLKMHGLL